MEGVDRAKATVLYKEAQKILVDEKVAIFLGEYSDIVVKRKSLKGFIHNSNYVYFDFYNMYRE